MPELVHAGIPKESTARVLNLFVALEDVDRNDAGRRSNLRGSEVEEMRLVQLELTYLKSHLVDGLVCVIIH